MAHGYEAKLRLIDASITPEHRRIIIGLPEQNNNKLDDLASAGSRLTKAYLRAHRDMDKC